MVRLICIVLHKIRSTLKGHHYLDEVLHPHALPIYQTVWNNFLFQLDNAPIPAIWQGTVLQAGQTGLPDPDPSPVDHLWDNRDLLVHGLYPFPAATLPITRIGTPLGEQWKRYPQGVGYYKYPGFF